MVGAQGRGGGNACAGDVVGAFAYRALRKGHARAGDRSRGFAAAAGTSYAVVVSTAGGRDLACGELRAKAAPQQVAEEPADEDESALDEDSADDESVDDDSFDPDEDMPDADEDSFDEDDDLDDGDDDF